MTANKTNSNLVVKKKVKMQSKIPLSTRVRLVKVAEACNITGTQAISDLIKEEYAKVFQKGE